MNKILYTPFTSNHITAHHIHDDTCLLIPHIRCYFGCLILLFCQSRVFSHISPYNVVYIQRSRRELNYEE